MRTQTGPIRALWLMALVVGLMLAQALAANARPESFADLAEKISPAVVNITTSTVVESGTANTPMVPEGSPFEEFFERFRDRMPEGDRPRRSSALDRSASPEPPSRRRVRRASGTRPTS